MIVRQKTAVCATVLLVVAAFAVMAVLWSRRSTPVAATRPPPPLLAASAPVDPVPEPGAAPSSDRHESDENVVPPLPVGATKVPDGHLLKLSAMVNLTNAEERHIDKDQWSRAVPIARRLVQGPCDCEQRNWLNHFIAMGDSALAGSDADYYKLAGLMRKMARNDQQLAAHPEFFAH